MDCNTCVKPALSFACSNGYTEIVETFVESGADIDSPILSGSMPLHIAAQMGHEKIVEMLLRHDVDIHKLIDWNGCTAFHVAAKYGRKKVVNILLLRTTDVDHQTNNGDSAMSLAARNGHDSVVKILLGHKANVGMRNKYGKTALDFARENGHENIVNMLSPQMAKVEKPTTVEGKADTKSKHPMPANREEAKSGERPETGGLENAETVETAESGKSAESEALVDDEFLKSFEIILLDELDDDEFIVDALESSVESV
jgi:Ankyrin repeats (3 copies)/Ankyrin repeats (many copies)